MRHVARSPDLAAAPLFARLDAWETGLCLRCNRLGDVPALRLYFAMVSRLGDGIAWYALLAVLLVVGGAEAVVAVLHMGLTSLCSVMIYKVIKGTLNRERPFAANGAVKPLLPPLDRYSFPSGHTLHAAAFAVMLACYYPGLLWLVLPFALSVAISRVVLGLHYPTDVAAGALLGSAIAGFSLSLVL